MICTSVFPFGEDYFTVKYLATQILASLSAAHLPRAILSPQLGVTERFACVFQHHIEKLSKTIENKIE